MNQKMFQPKDVSINIKYFMVHQTKFKEFLSYVKGRSWNAEDVMN